jgi:hypothetical protein
MQMLYSVLISITLLLLVTFILINMYIFLVMLFMFIFSLFPHGACLQHGNSLYLCLVSIQRKHSCASD